MSKKKYENEILEDMKPALEMGGLGIGSSLLGGALQPMLPAGTINPLTSTGRTLGTFVRPVATLGAMSIVTKQLKKLEKKTKRKT